MSKRTLRDGAAERLEAEVARLTHDLEFVLADYRGFQSVMRGLVERGAVRAEDVRSVEQFLHPILEKEGRAMGTPQTRADLVAQIISDGKEIDRLRAFLLEAHAFIMGDGGNYEIAYWIEEILGLPSARPDETVKED